MISAEFGRDDHSPIPGIVIGRVLELLDVITDPDSYSIGGEKKLSQI
jgi:hypothetical protein